MEWKMHTDTEIQPSVGSLTTNIQGRISRLAAKMQRWITSLVKKAKKALVFDRSAHWIHDTIPPAAVLAGAAAFGFWWDSVSAGLFACFALFFGNSGFVVGDDTPDATIGGCMIVNCTGRFWALKRLGWWNEWN